MLHVGDEKHTKQKHGLIESSIQNINVEPNAGILSRLNLQKMLLKEIPKEDRCRCLTTQIHNGLSNKMSRKRNNKVATYRIQMISNKGH